MFAQVHTPSQLAPAQLDHYLEQGWFRMGQTIFTTNFIHFKEEMYSTIWLRIVLNEYVADNTAVKLAKRNAKFQVTIQPAVITEEKEALYARYKQVLPFQTSDSLRHLLFGITDRSSIYNTYEVTLHEDQQLIACGFFDLGETSAQGIASFYDPDFKKYSLGKYLIYLKVHFCQERGIRYFYPGYFVPGYAYFDYKLTMGRKALQFLQLRTNSWRHIDFFSPEQIPFAAMQSRLKDVQALLTRIHVDCHVVRYEFFDANFIPELRDSGLFDFPVFLYFANKEEDNISPIIVFDVHDECFHLLSCMPVWKPVHTNPDKSFYSAYFIKTLHEIYVTAQEEEMAVLFMRLLKAEGVIH